MPSFIFSSDSDRVDVLQAARSDSTRSLYGLDRSDGVSRSHHRACRRRFSLRPIGAEMDDDLQRLRVGALSPRLSSPLQEEEGEAFRSVQRVD